MRKVTTTKGVELLVPEKGEKHPGAGRPKGSKNKITLGLKEALLVALETVGEDGKGKNGLTGYLIKVARTRPDLIVRMLVAVLKLEKKSKPEPVNRPEVPYETVDDVLKEFVRRKIPLEMWPPILRDRYEKNLTAADDLKIKKAAN